MKPNCYKWYGERHNWSRWEEVEKLDLTYEDNSITRVMVQERKCIDCGLCEKKVSNYLG